MRLRIVGTPGSGKSRLAAEVSRALGLARRAGRSRRGYPVGVTEFRFADEPDASRWTLRRGDDLVSVLDYRDDGRTVVMTRAYTVPTFRGHGYAGEIVDRAVAALEERGDRTVVPLCWYVADWFAAHPERAGILEKRRSA